MMREELEFRIARYANGDLTDAEGCAVEAELAGDSEARSLLAEYQTLRSAIEEAAGPALPKVHWDRLERLLSAAVAKSAAELPVVLLEEPANRTAALEGYGAAGDGPVVGSFETLGIETEFAIAGYSDGSLAPQGCAQCAQVEQLLASDARARAVLDGYRDVDGAIKALAYSDPPPAVGWDRLAARISTAVEAGANAGLPEDIERQIAAFVEGAHSTTSGQALSAEECAVEDRLAAEPAARLLASDYRNVDAALRELRSAKPVPVVDWERFASRISAAIEREAEPTPVRLRNPRADGYSILKLLRSPMRMALAASVLVGVALVTRLMHGGPGTVPTHAIGPAPAPRVEEIAVLQPEPPAGESQSDIRISAPVVARAGDDDSTYAADMGDDDDVVSRPPHAFVASSRTTPAEAEVLPGLPF